MWNSVDLSPVDAHRRNPLFSLSRVNDNRIKRLQQTSIASAHYGVLDPLIRIAVMQCENNGYATLEHADSPPVNNRDRRPLEVDDARIKSR
jgi:hypothetical protein